MDSSFRSAILDENENAIDEELIQNGVMDEELVQNVAMDEELVQNGVMDEELFQNGVMDEENQNCVMYEKFVKFFSMDAIIVPKVVVNLSPFKIGGRNILHSINRKLVEKLIDDNESRLFIKIPSTDSFFMMHYLEQHFVSADRNVEELMPLREKSS